VAEHRSKLTGLCSAFQHVVVAVFLMAATAVASAQIPDVPGWQLAWHDEFDGSSVNTTNWNLITLQNSYNNEKQYYLPGQASIVGGNLRITATNQPLSGKLYRSARLESKSAFNVGRFEARIDLPAGKGMWPAFWLNANAVQWPVGGEIDIMENKGSQPTITSSSFHWQKDPTVACCNQHLFVAHNYSATENGSLVNFQAGFHTYATEWDPTQIRFFVDGNQFFTVNQDSSMSTANFTTAKNIILNLAVGGDFDGDPNGTTMFPQIMDVDYVRVWTRQTGLLGDYNHDGMVDAADYTVWRDSIGQSGIGLDADGSGNGTIDQSDFDTWQSQFGMTAGGGAGAGSTATVPEPATVSLLLAGILVVWIADAQRHRRLFRP
jgi:beta-glucanase (GH16 family)